jgi:hypothetical protein
LGVKMYLKDFFISLSWVPYETWLWLWIDVIARVHLHEYWKDAYHQDWL